MRLAKRLFATLAIPALALTFSACDFDYEDEEGRLPDIDVEDRRDIDVDLPDDDVDLDIPDVDADVDVDTDR